jgi:hypothetical protein
MLVVLVDLGPTTFQHPYLASGALLTAVPPDLKRGELNADLNKPVPNHRIAYTTTGNYPNHAITWFLINTGLPHTLYIHPEHPLSGSAFGHPFKNEMNHFFANLENPGNLSSGKNADLMLAGFHLLNTQHVIIPQTEFTESLYYNFRNVRPVVVSARTTPWDFPVLEMSETETQEAFRRMVRAMGLNVKDRTCERILLLGSNGEKNLRTSPKANVIRHQVWNQRVELDLHVSADCFARLAYSYYPYLKVTLDGKPITPMQTAGRFIALKLSEGEHRIVLEGTLSPLRKGLLVMDLCLLLLAIGVIQYRKMRGKAESQSL